MEAWAIYHAIRPFSLSKYNMCQLAKFHVDSIKNESVSKTNLLIFASRFFADSDSMKNEDIQTTSHTNDFRTVC